MDRLCLTHGVGVGGGVHREEQTPPFLSANSALTLRERTLSTDQTMSGRNDSGFVDVDEDITLTFPQKLMEILSNQETGDVISWLPHGRGFLIYKKKKFAVEVLPKYFKQSKFTSFTRKLNRWGFTRVTRGPETGAYYHKLFQRGDLEGCMQMSCQTTNRFSSRGLTNLNQLSQVFPPQVHVAADLAQNQNLIRQQLQQLQLQQLQLEQLQLQQQQQIQAAEMMRAQIARKQCEVPLMDDRSQSTQMPSSQFLNMCQQKLQMQQFKEDSIMGFKMDANSLLMQSLQGAKDCNAGLIGGGPIALLPALGPQAFMAPRPPTMDSDGNRSAASGNGRAWAA